MSRLSESPCAELGAAPRVDHSGLYAAGRSENIDITTTDLAAYAGVVRFDEATGVAVPHGQAWLNAVASS